MPPRECTLLFVVGIAVWLLLRATTSWTEDSNWVYMPHLLVDLYVLGLLVCLLPKKWRPWALAIIYIIMYASIVIKDRCAIFMLKLKLLNIAI